MCEKGVFEKRGVRNGCVRKPVEDETWTRTGQWKKTPAKAVQQYKQ